MTSLAEAEHQLDVLDGGASGTLAEIVEARDEHGLIQRRFAEDVKLELIGAVQALQLRDGSAALKVPG